MENITDLSKEQVQKDVMDYLLDKAGDPELSLDDTPERYSVDDLDLIDMELELETKYFGPIASQDDGADLRVEDSISLICDKLFNYFSRLKNNFQ